MTQQPAPQVRPGFKDLDDYLAFLAEDAAIEEQRREPITEERVRRELQRHGEPTDQDSINCAISDQDFARECGWLQ